MRSKSTAIVGFVANLMPLYIGERHENFWCARGLQDGTLILPFSEVEDAENEGWIRVCWQGDRLRQTEVLGEHVAALALERYVRLHGAGVDEEAIAAELYFLAQHFTFKTGCHIYLPQLKEPAHPAVRAVRRMGEGVLVNLLSKMAGA
ncbi:hypothetical protein CLM74_11130 [Stenotrophomonas sp. MYb57]|jgi:hypothetical protein|uniref:hypothetical protein n=1 Tax=Stenotrophomonas sp. MYb57 TaxID=1827305 RepID=UPI000CF5F062|nr:hypothetical protein [Stenotrophomonas sp. MYb57]AVJ33278.1 hypothetical protein CLM74_11130 [Stenotrophomonas sp. MYb57]